MPKLVDKAAAAARNVSARSRSSGVAAIAAAAAAALSSCATTYTQAHDLPPLEAVPQVDLQRYMGTWYEIASIPQSFQRGCTKTTATYSLRKDGTVDVVNRCIVDGKEKVARGRARVAESSSKLEVSFFGPFWAPYWIINLAGDYSTAVVGHPSRDYLWILSRTPTLDAQTYAGLIARAQALGYDTGRLVRTE